MSDLFVGEILILILLVPVLLRPFFRRLQGIAGIAILPLLSLLLSFGVLAADGFSFSFLPVILYALLVFIVNFVRMMHLFTGLPTDWYSTPAIVLYVFLIVIFFGTGWMAVTCAPEPNRISQNEITRTFSTESISSGTKLHVSVWEPVKKEPFTTEGLVVIASDSAIGLGARNTTAAVLSEKGYIVVEGNSKSKYDYINPILLFPEIRKTFFLFGRLLPFINKMPDIEEIASVQFKSLERLVSWTSKQYGQELPLYIIAEGDSIPSVATMFADNPTLFAGIVCISANKHIRNFFPENSTFAFDISGGSLPSASSVYPVCVFSGSNSSIEGLGEIDANDVLLSYFLGGGRDSKRVRAELIARRIESWIQMRSVYGFEGS